MSRATTRTATSPSPATSAPAPHRRGPHRVTQAAPDHRGLAPSAAAARRPAPGPEGGWLDTVGEHPLADIQRPHVGRRCAASATTPGPSLLTAAKTGGPWSRSANRRCPPPTRERVSESMSASAAMRPGTDRRRRESGTCTAPRGRLAIFGHVYEPPTFTARRTRKPNGPPLTHQGCSRVVSASRPASDTGRAVPPGAGQDRGCACAAGTS